MQRRFILRVLFVLVVAVTTLSSAIAVDQQQDGDKRSDWSGTTDRAEADGQPLIVEMEDSRSSRAAEIQATKLNFAAESSTSSSTTSTTTQVPTTTDEPDWSLDDKETASSTPSSETESLPTTSPSVVVSTLSTITSTIANLNSSSAAEEEEEEIRRFATTTTPASTTNDQVSSTVTNMNGDEYVADDHVPSLTTDNEGIIDQEMEHKSGSTLSAIQAATTTTTTTPTEVPVTWTATSTTTIKPLSHLMTAAAVGRSLAQEENVAWPESKSTKVIGTIIEDIHSPAASSSSTAAESITNGSIVAIALCSVCLIVSSLGASGYWWYRRRYLTNRPETLSDRYAPSETGATGEDIFRVGYVHSPEMPRDSSEEMYSLDNDSFLTSLEAMTIPTYWTETIKHTKL